MTIPEQLKTKVEVLKNIQEYISHLKQQREYNKDNGLPTIEETEAIEKYIEEIINNYKQLVQDLRKQHGE